MAEYRFITGKNKQWADFLRSMKEGDEVIIGVDSDNEIDVIRTVASRINTGEGLPYKFSVEAQRDLMVVRITTKRPLLWNR